MTKQQRIAQLEAKAFGIYTALNALTMGYGHHTLAGADQARRYLRQLRSLKTRINRLESQS